MSRWGKADLQSPLAHGAMQECYHALMIEQVAFGQIDDSQISREVSLLQGQSGPRHWWFWCIFCVVQFLPRVDATIYRFIHNNLATKCRWAFVSLHNILEYGAAIAAADSIMIHHVKKRTARFWELFCEECPIAVRGANFFLSSVAMSAARIGQNENVSAGDQCFTAHSALRNWLFDRAGMESWNNFMGIFWHLFYVLCTHTCVATAQLIFHHFVLFFPEGCYLVQVRGVQDFVSCRSWDAIKIVPQSASCLLMAHWLLNSEITAGFDWLGFDLRRPSLCHTSWRTRFGFRRMAQDATIVQKSSEP